MKTVLAAVFALGAVFVLGWIAILALNNRPEDSNLTMHPSNFEKASIEWVVAEAESEDVEEGMVEWENGEEE